MSSESRINHRPAHAVAINRPPSLGSFGQGSECSILPERTRFDKRRAAANCARAERRVDIYPNNVKIYPNSFIGDNVTIGDNVYIFAGAKIYSETIIGNFCTIHSGTIIGADGFGFVPNEDGEYNKVPQIGNVIIEDNVDIGANTTIDRATLGSTIIRKGVKLDNQIQIAHNVEVGKNTVIAAQTGVAGSTKIGENCMIGGQVGIAGHLIIGNNVRLQAQSGVARNIKDDEILQGSPSLGYGDFNKSYVHFKNLPKIVSELDELKKQIINPKNGNNG